MRCKRVNILMDDYLKGNLVDETLHEFESHIKNCTKCQSNLSISKSLRELASEDASDYIENPFFANSVLARIEQNRISAGMSLYAKLASYAAVAAAIILGLFIGMEIGSFGTQVISTSNNAELIAEDYIPSSTENLYIINAEDVENQNK
jgi:anti-sigma factor RsiW